MNSYQPRRYLIAFATVTNNMTEGISVPVTFIENPPPESKEEPKIVGYSHAFVRIPKFESYEFEKNKIVRKNKNYDLEPKR